MQNLESLFYCRFLSFLGFADNQIVETDHDAGFVERAGVQADSARAVGVVVGFYHLFTLLTLMVRWEPSATIWI